MKIAVLAHPLFPIAEPFAGGLEMIIHSLVRQLEAHGHEVHLYAHPNSDPRLNIYPVRVESPELTDRYGLKEEDGVHHLSSIAFAKAIYLISQSDYDLVHSHILNGMVLQQLDKLEIPVIHTFHTPHLPALLTGVFTLPPDSRIHFTAVSEHLANHWREVSELPVQIVYNGIDLEEWNFTENMEKYVFWCGRICKEKAPHHALQAAIRAGRPVVFAGPIHDQAYFEDQVEPLCHNSEVTYLGHLPQSEIGK